MELSRKSSDKTKCKQASVPTTINNRNQPKTCDGFDIIDRSEALEIEVGGGGGKGGGTYSADDDDDSAQIISLVDTVRTKVSNNMHS